MEKIKGLIDAPFTPFDRNGDVNCEPIPAYAAMLHKNGLKGVFINGSSGEGYMLTTEERMALAEKCIIGKTKCDEIKNEMRPSWRKAWSKRNATKISHTRKNTVRTTTKRCSNGIFLSQKQRSLRSLLVIANHPLLLSTTTRFRGTDGPLDAVDDPPVALGVSVDHIERKHRQHKLSLHCLE